MENFTFSRYIVTGVNPAHYGDLRGHGFDGMFNYEGCLDAPTYVAGGSHEYGNYCAPNSTSIADRGNESC